MTHTVQTHFSPKTQRYSHLYFKFLPHWKLLVFGKEIEQVTQIEYLGINLDMHLTNSPHIDHLSQKTAQTVEALAKVTKCLDRSPALALYNLNTKHRKMIISWLGPFYRLTLIRDLLLL